MTELEKVLHNYKDSDRITDERIDKINEKADEARGVFVGSSYTNTETNTYEYTGLSVTVPANKIYEIMAYDVYANASPLGICIATTSDTSTLISSPSIIGENVSTASTNKSFGLRSVVTMSSLSTNNQTYYLFVKRGNAGKNNIGIWYRCLN